MNRWWVPLTVTDGEKWRLKFETTICDCKIRDIQWIFVLRIFSKLWADHPRWWIPSLSGCDGEKMVDFTVNTPLSVWYTSILVPKLGHIHISLNLLARHGSCSPFVCGDRGWPWSALRHYVELHKQHKIALTFLDTTYATHSTFGWTLLKLEWSGIMGDHWPSGQPWPLILRNIQYARYLEGQLPKCDFSRATRSLL